MQDQDLKKQEAKIANIVSQINTLKAWITALVMIVVFTSVTFGRLYAEVFSFYESSLEDYHMTRLYLQDFNSDLEEQMKYLEDIAEIARRMER